MSPYSQQQQEDDPTLAGLRQVTGLGGNGGSPLAGPQPLTPKAPAAGTGITPVGQQPANDPFGQGATGGGAPAPAGGGGAGQSTTFAQLQAGGIARPAPPAPTPPQVSAQTPMAGAGPGGAGWEDPGMAPSPYPTLGSQAGVANSGITPYGGGMANERNTDDPPLSDDPNNPPPPPPPPAGGGTPDKPPANTPPPAPGSGKYPLQDDIEAAIKKLLGTGSPYDDAHFQSDVERGYNTIDDQYNLGQKNLTDQLASRGLGTANDSSIGLGRMSDLNVGRKTAKESVLSDLSSQRARSMMGDLTSELGLATSYGQGAQQLTLEQQQQQFNTQLAIAQLLAQLGYKMPAGSTAGG